MLRAPDEREREKIVPENTGAIALWCVCVCERERERECGWVL